MTARSATLMADESKAGTGFSLKRWSQRKHESARGAQPATPSGDDKTTPLPGVTTAPTADAVAAPPPADSVALPPVETLTFDSDFAAFMQPKVEEGTRRAALKKLFGDPSFNVMDGLDIYVGDYTQPDPMPAGMLDKLANVYGLLDSSAEASDAVDVPACGNDVAPEAAQDEAQAQDAPEAADAASMGALPAAAPDVGAGPPVASPAVRTYTADGVAGVASTDADGDTERA